MPWILSETSREKISAAIAISKVVLVFQYKLEQGEIYCSQEVYIWYKFVYFCLQSIVSDNWCLRFSLWRVEKRSGASIGSRIDKMVSEVCNFIIVLDYCQEIGIC
jgi:hypothetical protein